MLVNCCYMNYGYAYACHSIVVVVTFIIDASCLVQSYAHASNSHVW